MYARVVLSTPQQGKMDEMIKVARDSILPAAKKQKGFKNWYTLTNRNAGKVIVIGIWNTEADMMANESSGFYKEQIAKVAPLLTGPPTMEHYEVSVKG